MFQAELFQAELFQGKLMRIYGDLNSGNCLKIKYLCDHLRVPYEWTEVDLMAGETRDPAFLALNPSGQVPTVLFDDGRQLAESNAILTYLAEGSPLLPSDRYQRAKVMQWLFWEQYSHEPYVAVVRFQKVYLKRSEDELDKDKLERAYKALDLLEKHLTKHDWIANDQVSIADIALLAYSRLAPEGGMDLLPRKALRAWIARCETLLGIDYS